MSRDRRMVALIVEEDRIESELGAAVLTEFDLAVRQVRSAEEAILHLVEQSGNVTVLLADAGLPGAMSGLTLARRVSVLWPAISVILLSDQDGFDLGDLPARTACLRRPWRALDIVAAAERAARHDHSVRAVQLR